MLNSLNSVRRILAFASISAVAGCEVHAGPCVNYSYPLFSDYSFRKNAVTVEGIEIDTSGYEVDLSEVDEVVDRVESWGRSFVPDPSGEEWCLRDTQKIRKHIARSCIRIRIAPDWFWSKHGEEQLLPFRAPDEECIKKAKQLGRQYDESFGCWFRGGIQYDGVQAKRALLVLTPNMRMLDHTLARWVTSCYNLDCDFSIKE